MADQNYGNETLCTGRICGFQVAGESLGCITGSGGCASADLLEAEPSAFFDDQMAEATRAIKEILAGIPADPNGRMISFINTNAGTLLAWVDHSGAVLENAVTQNDDDATIADALKLKNVTLADAAPAN